MMRCRPNAFTLIELLVVISVIALLIGILIPALGAARRSAFQTRELASLRQVMTGYTAYAGDAKDRLLPGYLTGGWAYGRLVSRRDFSVFDNPNDSSEASRLEGGLIRTYTWRLMPYVGYSFETLFTDKFMREQFRTLTMDKSSRDGFHAAVARNPSFGLNTTFVGGDAHRGGFSRRARLRWGNFYITRADQVMNSSSLIAFATARGTRGNGLGQIVPGYHRIEAPWHATPTSGTVPAFVPWTAPRGTFVPSLPTSAYGHVDFRASGKALAAMMDGHADRISMEQALDMRRWSNQAGKADWRPR